MNIINKKSLVVLIFFSTFIAITGCQQPGQLAEESAASTTGSAETKQDEAIAAAQASADAAQASADAAMTRANEAFQQAQTVRRIAERAVEMANQNQAALRALNDKIDRMFETISRK